MSWCLHTALALLAAAPFSAGGRQAGAATAGSAQCANEQVYCGGAGSNTVSTAEQAVLCILAIVRNYPMGHRQIVSGEWNLAEASSIAHDIEGKHIGRAVPPAFCASCVTRDPRDMA